MKKFLQDLRLIICFLTAFSLPSQAQYVLKDADKQYELFNYAKAIDLYEQAFKKKESLHAAERLANAYAYMNNYRQAESWYAIASKMPNSNLDNVLGYAKALQNNARFSEAKVEYQNYIAQKKDVAPWQQNVWLSSCDSAIRWMKSPKPIELINQKELNSVQSDWGAVTYQGGMVFTSDRTHPGFGLKEKTPFLKFDGAKLPDKNIYGWTGNGYLRLYLKSSPTDSLKLFPIKTGTKYHVGPASFTADGKTMYFTMTAIPNDLEKVKNRPSTVNVGIYCSTQDADGNWGEPVRFKYNEVNKFSVGDPFITPNGGKLYFSSDMHGGSGGTDLYVCLKTESGDWASPVNLKEINTPGNERTPFFDEKDNFYFSSDGRVGMGALDVFRAPKVGANIGSIENLGYPFNSPQDDFGFYMDGKDLIYLSSNRENGVGGDDIYTIDQKLIFFIKLQGKVFDKQNKQPISNALITLVKTNGSTMKVETDDTGTYQFDLSKNANYQVLAEKTNFNSDGKSVTTSGLNTTEVLKQDLYLDPIVINKSIRLENIYYDFDKWNIRPDAAVELDKLVKIMTDNPTIWIELGSHTDSRGKDAYNLSLSQKRVQFAMAYIISKGINKNRITAKGYGETQLLNKCANHVECSEAGHHLNRRTEFKIVKL